MPTFEASVSLACTPERAWEFLCRPANLVLVSPPELHPELVKGPERLQLGSRITVQGRRWGISQRVTSEVTQFVEGNFLVDEQKQGPFGKFVHTHKIEPVSGGTKMTDRIDYAAPGGMLGFLLTEKMIAGELEEVFAYRTKKLKEILEGP
jgi:ligand-binding SRPBCC domain-containing protein